MLIVVDILLLFSSVVRGAFLSPRRGHLRSFGRTFCSRVTCLHTLFRQLQINVTRFPPRFVLPANQPPPLQFLQISFYCLIADLKPLRQLLRRIDHIDPPAFIRIAVFLRERGAVKKRPVEQQRGTRQIRGDQFPWDRQIVGQLRFQFIWLQICDFVSPLSYKGSQRAFGARFYAPLSQIFLFFLKTVFFMPNFPSAGQKTDLPILHHRKVFCSFFSRCGNAVRRNRLPRSAAADRGSFFTHPKRTPHAYSSGAITRRN